MSFWEALVLGIVQGVTEFLPVSSSGHLAVLSNLFHIQTGSGILFEVLLHMGTLLAVFAVFRGDLYRMFLEIFRMGADVIYNIKALIHNRFQGFEDRSYKKILHNNYRKLTAMILVSTVPTALIGYLTRPLVEQAGTSLLWSGLGFLITAVLLLVIDYWNYGRKIPKNITMKEALLIGICQGFGTFPGISRAGITITACLLCGFQRKFSVRYSFLISIPATIGAMLLECRQLTATSWSLGLLLNYLVGMAAAAVCGYFCIRAMLVLIQKKRFLFFAVYCALIGTAALVGYYVLPAA